MKSADEIYCGDLRNILVNGTFDVGDVRARWADGEPARTKKVVGISHKYDLGNWWLFPVITVRQTYIKNAVKEILWIWQKRSNKIEDLGLHIWDSWADENGTIGKAYGYQLGKKVFSVDGQLVDQVDYAIHQIKTNPNSKRIVCSMWDVDELSEMNLQPCAFMLHFVVTGDTLNAILYQRSQDMVTAGNWNVVQYSILLMMIAQVTGKKAGTLTHMIGDCHIYDRHLDFAKEMSDDEQYANTKAAPVIGTDILLNPDVKRFEDFTPDDVIINRYDYVERDWKIPVAI